MASSIFSILRLVVAIFFSILKINSKNQYKPSDIHKIPKQKGKSYITQVILRFRSQAPQEKNDASELSNKRLSFRQQNLDEMHSFKTSEIQTC